MKKTTKQWVAKIARENGVSVEEVLRYLRNLSNGDKVIHHLRLG